MKKIPVGILGATGSVGQKFVELLSEHPWFEITALGASERSAGKPYKEAVNWLMPKPLCSKIGQMKVLPCEPNLPCSIVFSSLDAAAAGDIEQAFADNGYIVFSNARSHRMHPNVPLIVPEVNPHHLSAVESQQGKGKIITNPNCSTIGLVIALKPLIETFGLEAVSVVTMQAISGAGYPGVASLDIIDNVIPFISGEEEKMETETHKILGGYSEGVFAPTTFKISAHCNRVPVSDGHTESVSVKLKKPALAGEVIKAWKGYTSVVQQRTLPSAPQKPIHYFEEASYPQPKLHRLLENGMTISIGRLRPCNVFDYKFTLLSHNTIRGAAGGAVLSAELFASSYFKSVF